MGQDLLCKPLIEGREHPTKIQRAPIEIHNTAEKFRADRDRFSKLVRLLIMELRKWGSSSQSMRRNRAQAFCCLLIEATSHHRHS